MDDRAMNSIDVTFTGNYANKAGKFKRWDLYYFSIRVCPPDKNENGYT